MSLVLRVHPENRELKELLVPPVAWERMVNKETEERSVLPETREMMELSANQATMALLDLKVVRDPMVRKVLMAHRARLAPGAITALPEPQALLDPSVTQDPMAFKALLAPSAQSVPTDLKVRSVRLARLVIKAPTVSVAPSERLVLMVLRVTPVALVLSARQELMERLAATASLAKMELQAHPDLKDPTVKLALPVFKVAPVL